MNQYKLIICEKPSQAQSYASVLHADERRDGFFIGNSYLVAWCFGHLLSLAPPEVYKEQYAKWRYTDLPIIPVAWQHVPDKSKTAQLKILKELMNRMDVECVINACDAGREGELIFRLVYEYAACKKPIKRLWISSMEDSAIKNGFASLRDGSEYETLYTAALCRECADWAVGLNCTRLFTVLYGVVLTTGRVQSPTLSILVLREAEISSFVKEPFYTPVLNLNGFTASGTKFKTRSDANAISISCENQIATITEMERTIKSVSPPKLYDLTSLQRDANRLLGYTAQQTLDYIQALYEKKLTSYPRTDAKYITADMTDTVIKILGNTDFSPNIDVLIGHVSDHHAIIPTLESRNADISALPDGEYKVFELVRKRLLAAVSPKHLYEAVTITIDCSGNIFTAKGKTIITPGWKIQSDQEDDDTSLPPLSKGQTFEFVKSSVKEGFTKPKPHYTEDTLLSAMESAGAEDMPDEAERKGLGTPATRAPIIEKLIKSGFIERSKKNLLPTEKGKNLIAVLPPSLTSAKLTAEWEHKLLQVQHGELESNIFMTDIADFIKSIVSDNKTPKPELLSLFPPSQKQSAKSLGTCPRCGSPVREGQKGYFCDKHDCGFKLWKESKFWTMKKKPLTAEIVTALLKNGRVRLKNLHSEKTGKMYSATVILDDKGEGFVDFKMTFE